MKTLFSRTAIVAASLLLASAVSAADRDHAPVPGAPRPVVLPKVEHRQLANGLPVLLVEQHEVPTAVVLLLIGSGATADPDDRPGTATMAADMLDEGAGDRDSLSLSDALDMLGASISTGASWDYSSVSLHVPVAHLADALPIMADVAQRPRFAAAELDRLRQQALTGLLQLRDRPQALASIAQSKALFGEHRYARLANGDARSLASLTPEALRQFHAQHYRPGNATLIVVGDVTSSSVVGLLDSAFGSWAKGGDKAPPVAEVKPLAATTVWLVDRPHAPQSTIRVSEVGPSRTTPLYHAREVMNAMLGGLFTSRLNTNLRETHQYAYGAASGFSYRRVGGSFSARSDVQTPSTALALTEILKEIARMQTPAPLDEVKRARSYLAMGYASDFETPGQIASEIAEQVIYGLPEDTFASFVPSVLAIAPKDVQKAAAASLHPKQLAIVIVGDLSVIEKPVRALNLGAVKIVTADDLLGPMPKLGPLAEPE